MAEDDAKLIVALKRKYETRLRKRDGWRNTFTLLYKYILMRPTAFGDTVTPSRTPKLSVANVSDDEVIDAARTSAAALGGALLPNIAESFELVPKRAFNTIGTDEDIFESSEIKEYFQQSTRIVRSVIGAPEAGYFMAFDEHLDETVVIGTSGLTGIEDEEDEQQPCYFRSVSIETAVFEENSKGAIDKIDFEFYFTPSQIVEKYGEANVSQRVKDLIEADKDDEYIRVVQSVYPRGKGKEGAEVEDKPYASVHWEYDNNHLLKKSGMDELNTWINRFRKRPNEMYGRSLGNDALPTVKELNVLRRGFSLALGKKLDPPIGFYSDMVGGNGQVDISAGAKVPLYSTGRIPQGQLPIIQLLKIEDPAVANLRMDSLTARIAGKFLVDKLLDFNNKTRMTAFETDKRDSFRSQGLGSVFSRQMNEVQTPSVKWTIKVLLRRKWLGLHPIKDALLIQEITDRDEVPFVIPASVAAMLDKGQDPFECRWISPAARAMKADALMGLEKLSNYVLAFTNAGKTDAADNLDSDRSIRIYQDYVGAPVQAMRSQDDMEKLRKDRQDGMAKQSQLQAQEATAKITAQGAKAAKDFAAAGTNAAQSGLLGGDQNGQQQ